MTSKKRVPGARAPGDGATPRTPRKNAPSAQESVQALLSSSGAAQESTDQAKRLPDLAPNGLTPLQWRFAQEFIVDLNGTQAYIRARPDTAVATAEVLAARLLGDVRVRAEIQRLMDDRAKKTGITAERVFLRAWDIATADARELGEFIIGSCRHCWGLYNQYQYTEAEMALAQDKHIREETKRAKAEGQDFVPKAFAEKGGPGYDPRRPPNPECPECWGDGEGRPVLKDTRLFSPAAAALFDGLSIKRSKEGETINFKTQDRGAYLTLVARHLGMLNDKLKIGEDEENPLFALLRQIQGAHSALPVVHNDPGRAGAPGAPLPMADVVDVQSKTVQTPVKRKQWKAG